MLGGWSNAPVAKLRPLIHPFLDSLRMFFSTLSNILGAVILIAIVLPWFLIAVFSISALYLWAAMFYRASARELKRLGKPF